MNGDITTGLKLTKDVKGQMKMEFIGADTEIVEMLVFALAQNLPLATIILSAIPSYLDITDRSRAAYANILKDAKGATPDERKRARNLIIMAGGKIQ